jgi:myosin heavy chain 6/7
MFFLFQTKPYDAKKSCWVPDEKEGFVLGEIRNATGDQVTVAFANKVKQ